MIKPTQKQIQAKKDEVLKKKIKWETRLKVDFKGWQQKVYESFIIQKRTGASIVYVPNELKSNLRFLLTLHYYDVIEDFVPGTDMGDLKQNISGEPMGEANPEQQADVMDFLIPAVLLDIEKSMRDQIAVNVPFRVDSIVDTTARLGNEATVITARTPESSYETVLANKLASKTTTVSISETTWIAESAMGTALTKTTPILPQANPGELKDLQKISPNVTLGNIDVDKLVSGASAVYLGVMEQLTHPRKTWISTGDKKVRKSHQAATGITVNLNEAFILPGGRLMYPTDTSLGASIEETINCRCWAMYF